MSINLKKNQCFYVQIVEKLKDFHNIINLYIKGNPLKSSSLKFDRIFNFNNYLPASYQVVEKSKGILLMYVFYSLGLN